MMNNDGHICPDADIKGFQISVSYLVNEHDGKDYLVKLRRYPVVKTIEVHFQYLVIRQTQQKSAGQSSTGTYAKPSCLSISKFTWALLFARTIIPVVCKMAKEMQ